MVIIMRTAANSDEVYFYIRSIINRDGSKVIGVFSDPEVKKHVVIIAEVNSPKEVDIGFDNLLSN